MKDGQSPERFEQGGSFIAHAAEDFLMPTGPSPNSRLLCFRPAGGTRMILTAMNTCGGLNLIP